MRLDSVRHRLIVRYSFLAAAAIACAGGDTRGGTLVISAAGDADVLFPPTIRQQQAQQVTELLFEKLADIGPDLNTVGDAGWTPRLADRWEWSRDSMAVTFHLDPRARWHDGVPVRAADVRFAYSIYVDPAIGASDGAAISGVVDSITAADSLTCTVWFKRRSPERFYTVVYNLVPLPEHLLGRVPRDSIRTSPFTRQPVGNGPYTFVRWDPNQRIEIAAFEGFHRGRANIDRVIWSIVPDGNTAVQRVFTGEADFIFTLTSAQAAEVSAHPDVRSMHLGSRAFAFLLFNARDGTSDRPHPILGDRALRRALSMAVDRQSVVTNLLDSLGRVAIGPFSRTQWPADTTLRQLPFDRAAAARTLDSLGWHAGKDGVRVRQGRPLVFSVLVPASSPNRQRLAVLLQEQWRQVGVQLRIDGLDFAAMDARMSAKHFDAVLMQLSPSPSPAGLRQAWSTAAITMSNGLNIGRFSNAALDALIDSAVNAPTIAAGRVHYRAAYQTLIDDAPAVWLYEPIIVAGMQKRVTVAQLRHDAWWASIPSWRVSGAGPRADSSTRRP